MEQHTKKNKKNAFKLQKIINQSTRIHYIACVLKFKNSFCGFFFRSLHIFTLHRSGEKFMNAIFTVPQHSTERQASRRSIFQQFCFFILSLELQPTIFSLRGETKLNQVENQIKINKHFFVRSFIRHNLMHIRLLCFNVR